MKSDHWSLTTDHCNCLQLQTPNENGVIILDKYVGKRLDGRYEIKELIGMGGMSNVYKAFNVVEEKDVAIKILKEEFLNNLDFLKRFRNESKAIAALSHPNIVKIFDVNFGDRIQYIVMEHIDGITMKEYIEKVRALRWKDAVHFTVQILRALQHAHDRGIVHRDIKPHNIMLLQDGTIKVMDFGIARFAREDGHLPAEKAIGSVHYISPEQASGSQTDEKSDIYSIGVLLYEMLTGKLPFEGSTPERVAVQQMQAIPRNPREINDTIPEGLEEIIIRAMQKNPASRYQSVAEMLRDIDEFKRNPSILFEYKYFSNDGTTKYFDAVKGPNDMTDDFDENPDGAVQKKSATIPILAGIAVAFVIITILIVTVLSMFSSSPDDIPMPELVGMKWTDLQAAIHDEEHEEHEKYSVLKSIDFQFNEEEESDEHAKGVIIWQSIAELRTIKNTATVTLTLSAGRRRRTVPDLVGKTLQEAETLLGEDFTWEIVGTESNEIPKDTVIETTPAAGERVSKDTIIQIIVSLGDLTSADMASVPNVVGKPVDEAKRELTAAGFTPTEKSVDSTREKGIVDSQNPSGGAMIQVGRYVEILVSTGKSPDNDVNFSFNIPNNLKGKATLRMFLDGKEVRKQTVDLAVSGNSSYGFKLTGNASDSKVVVTIDGTRLAAYTADFPRGKSSRTEYHSSAFNSYKVQVTVSKPPPVVSKPPPVVSKPSQAVPPPPVSSEEDDPSSEDEQPVVNPE